MTLDLRESETVSSIQGLRQAAQARAGAAPAPLAYPGEAVLTFEQVCEWLQISRRQGTRLGLVDRVPHFYLGPREWRAFFSDLVAYFEKAVSA